VANWLEHDEDFKLEFEKVARAVERANALKAQDFLNEAGQGKKKKDDGITNANVVAAHMVLEAWDKRKWGQKVPEEKQGTKEISVIIKNYGRDERKVNVIDAPEVKLLPDGTDES
jgi:hypothetical protein